MAPKSIVFSPKDAKGTNDFDAIIMAACESEPWFAWDKMAKGIRWTGLKSITLLGGNMTQPFTESFLQRHSKTLQTKGWKGIATSKYRPILPILDSNVAPTRSRRGSVAVSNIIRHRNT
ncbi:hypothetical protein VE00_04791 [Pseudogymnoascus sp. WSF 3629]|nr:hypothetical protein VE00_04791 [Pseudogymnoascus sp. WSF 3629]